MRATQHHSLQKDFSRRVFPHQSLIKTMPYRLAYSLVFGGIFLSDILYSQMTVACVMLKKKINQQPTTKNQYIMGHIFTWTLFFIMHRSKNSSLLSLFLSSSSFCFTPPFFLLPSNTNSRTVTVSHGSQKSLFWQNEILGFWILRYIMKFR